MKSFVLFTASGPIVILTSHSSSADDVFVAKMRAKGVEKYIAFEVPWDSVEERYGGHFKVVMNDLHETDDLRVLDFNGQRIFQLFGLDELTNPQIHDPKLEKEKVYVD